MKGLRTMSHCFHSIETFDSTAYHRFNWTQDEWDNPWYDGNFWFGNKSSLLFSTNHYNIGEDTVEQIRLPLQPVTHIFKDQQVKNRLLGIPISYQDQTE